MEIAENLGRTILTDPIRIFLNRKYAKKHIATFSVKYNIDKVVQNSLAEIDRNTVKCKVFALNIARLFLTKLVSCEDEMW